MPTLPNLTKQKILDMATGEVYARGYDYYTHDRVLNVTQQGDTIYAEVEGSDYDPYEVVIGHASQAAWEISCTCPYDWGGLCKHSVAVLLYCMYNGDTMTIAPAVGESLTNLTREQLIELLTDLVEGDRTLGARVEQWIALRTGTHTSPLTSSPIDVATLRRSLKALRPSARASRSRYDDDYGYGITPDFYPILATCRTYLDANDGQNALSVLEVLTQVLTEDWTNTDYYEDEGLYSTVETVGFYFAEALLVAELPRQARPKWQVKLERWGRDLEYLDVNGCFSIAEEAAEQGWDTPAVVQILQGQAGTYQHTNNDLFEDDTLLYLRLRVLERQARWQEALHFATYLQEDRVVAIALWGLGEQAKAINHALTQFVLATQALSFATFLESAGDSEAALLVAEHGLTLEGPHYELGRWLIPIAEAQGRRDLAFQAAKVAFRSAIRLDTYDDLRRLAGDDWQTLRPVILKELATKRLDFAQYDNVLRILMQEGKSDDAIAVLEREMPHSAHAKQILIEEGIESKRPRWVVKASLEEANSIMDGAHSAQYEVAAHWLERVRDAYVALDEDEQWLELIAALLEKHKRKYKLTPLLKQL